MGFTIWGEGVKRKVHVAYHGHRRWAHLRFVKILVPEISESVVLDYNAEGQEIT